MPIIRSDQAAVHEVHGSTFRSYVAPSRAATQICSWELTVPAALGGAVHRPSRDEVLYLVEGQLSVTLDGERSDLQVGDVAFVPAGTELCVDGGAAPSRAWVTTTPGMEAVMDDGSRFVPPWAS